MTSDASEITDYQLLSLLDVGSPVAEHDTALERYFVETPIFRTIIEDKADIIAGDKGTGKTALFSIIQKRYTQFAELNDIEVVAAFNPSGTPVFQRLLEAGTLSEAQYISVWKAYFASLAGNWILEFVDEARTPTLDKLDAALTDAGLRAADTAPSTLFSQLVNRLKQIKNIEIEHQTAVTPEGIPIFTGRVRLDGNASEESSVVNPDDILVLLDEALREQQITLWMVLDRLDEAFQSTPEVEKPALRALFRAYLDMQNLEYAKLKMFVRNDLFARIIEGGFVNLTHINARRTTITWDDDDLWDLLIRRVQESTDFNAVVGPAVGGGAQETFSVLFPEKVDMADRKPVTWAWILRRIRDGNDVKAPRNLITLVTQAQSAQLRRLKESKTRWDTGTSLISGESMKRGLSALSSERVEDTLLAEAGENARLIELFRNGKSEHNTGSLATILGDDHEQRTKILRSLGFLEQVGSSFKVPMLYRDGLSITQGKAFAVAKAATSTLNEEDEEDEDFA